MKIERIFIKNFKVFKETEINQLTGLNAFLGANGSGKTTLIDVFSFLIDSLNNNVSSAIARRGGFNSVVSQNGETEKKVVQFVFIFSDSKMNAKYTYSIHFTESKGKANVELESIEKNDNEDSEKVLLMEYKNGKGFAINEMNNQTEYLQLTNSEILALKGIGQFNKFITADKIRSFIENIHISYLDVKSCANIVNIGDGFKLSASGDNLAQVALNMSEYHHDIFESIVKKLPKRIPGIVDVEVKTTLDNRILLRFKDENFNAPFLARQVSEGTLKMFAYLILLNEPEHSSILCIEEPETSLHPDLLLELCEELREYSEKGGQVIFSTHSPDLVNGLAIDELRFLLKNKGFSIVKAVKDDVQVRELAQDNQLGWLWRNHYIKGANLK